MRRVAALVAGLALLPAAAADAAKAPPAAVGTTMTVGVGLGAIKPFVSAKEVRGLLGKPNKTVRANGALAWLDYQRKYGLTVYFKTNSPDSGVFSVKVLGEGYATGEGLAVGDPLDKVAATYPEAGCTGLKLPLKKTIRCSQTSISQENGYEYSSEVIVGKRGKVKGFEVGLSF